MEIACVHRSINRSINSRLLENWFCLAFFALIVEKMFQKQFWFSWRHTSLLFMMVIIIHDDSLIFTIMQITPTHTYSNDYANSTWPMTPEATPDPYEYSSILSIDYVTPIVQKINKKRQKKSNLTTYELQKKDTILHVTILEWQWHLY